MKRLTKEIFIYKSKQIHGDKYDYSKVNYINNKTKICIICPEHGEFWQTPSNHLQGKGCPECGKKLNIISKTKTNKEYIEEVKEIYGNKYKYNKLEYTNCKNKICVTCKEHGDFYINPVKFLNGQGCPICLKNRIKKILSKTTDDFIKISSKIHNNYYSYKKVKYVNDKTKVCIICPEHGEFWQTPSNHLQGKGCPECGKIKQGFKRRLDFNNFLKSANLLHNNKYKYLKSTYTKASDYLTIICPEHGEFQQKGSMHLIGNGCPFCQQSYPEQIITNFLKNNNIKFVYQKHFVWLGNKSLDFYLTEYNIAIEYQGEQHFKVVDFGGEGFEKALEKYKKSKERDKIKENLCEKNSVKLYYILYTENIIDKLRYILQQSSIK